jgi:AraC-like DNA-binding protein
MMDDKGHIQLSNLLYTCGTEKQRGNEQFVYEHALGYVVSGEMQLITTNGIVKFKAGSVGLVRRNQLIKTTKVPPPGGEFRSLSIFLSQDFLRRYSAENKLAPVESYKGAPLYVLRQDAYLKGYFDSLLPYFAQDAQPNAPLAELKTREATELLLRHDPKLGSILFDFSEPGKIDLESFMNRNYMYNVPAAKFATLTGRSLASFKRDFEKVFRSSPGQWLLQKRLAEARYLISEKGRKPSDVYLDVGFENLSHFSYSFKKAYGVAPSMM